MEDNKTVRVKLYSGRKHYAVIDVQEDEVEKVRSVNRLTWRELDKEIRQRKQLEKDGVVITSLESIDVDNAWIPDDSPIAEERIIEEETHREIVEKLNNAISQLEPRQQEMIKLVYFEGKTQNEVAELLGISKSAISHCFERIYASLEKSLRKDKIFSNRPSTVASETSYKGEGLSEQENGGNQ